MKKIIVLLMTVVFILCFSTVAFALAPETTPATTQSFSTEGITTTTQPTVIANPTLGDPITADNLGSGGIPDVKIGEAQKWIEKKGFDIVSLAQTFVQPFAVVLFILCAMLSGVGAFGNSNLLSKGIMGMMISILVYAVVLSAPELMNWTFGWLKS
jgi:hypothetical protein